MMKMPCMAGGYGSGEVSAHDQHRGRGREKLRPLLELLSNLLGEAENRFIYALPPGFETGGEWGMVRDPHSRRPGEAVGMRPRFKPAGNAHEADGDGEPEGQPDGAELERLHSSIERPTALGKDQHGFSSFEKANDPARRLGVRLISVHRESPEPPDQRTEQWDSEEGLPRQIVDWSAERDRDQNWIGVGNVVGEEQERPIARDVLDSVETDPEVETSEPPHKRPGELYEGLDHFLIMSRRSQRNNASRKPRGGTRSASISL